MSRLEAHVAAQAMRDLTTWPIIQIDPALILAAIARSHTARLSFWDALIVEAALSGDASELYSEDLQDGLVIEGMRISNPIPPDLPAPQAH